MYFVAYAHCTEKYTGDFAHIGPCLFANIHKSSIFPVLVIPASKESAFASFIYKCYITDNK